MSASSEQAPDASPTAEELARRVAHLESELRRRDSAISVLRRRIASHIEDHAEEDAEATDLAWKTSERAAALPDPAQFPRLPAGKYDVIVLSMLDWGFRFQRPQQLAVQFARHGHRVFYLSSTELHEQQPYRLESQAPGLVELWVFSPRPFDALGSSLSAGVTNAVSDALAVLRGDYAIGDAVLLVQNPYWQPLAQRLRERFGWRVVYDCMDEWQAMPGVMPPVLAAEQALLRTADVVSFTSGRLAALWQDATRAHLIVRNAVDGAHYQTYEPNDLLQNVAHPIIGYFGAFASWVDSDLMVKIAQRWPDATFVVAGGALDADLAALVAQPNVRYLGERPYAEMPLLLWHFDVCTIPFHVNELTEATNPVKIYEYFWGGKPVVAPPLIELAPFADVCYLADGHEAFLDQIGRALAEDDRDLEARRRAIARANDWANRYQALHTAITDDALFPTVSVIIVTYGRSEVTRACLESVLERSTWPALDIIVVDNASPDDTVTLLQEVAARDDRVRLILNDENRGFAAANNQGIKAATGQFLLLLNNDTVVPAGAIGGLVRALEDDPSLGIVGPTSNSVGNEAQVEVDYLDPEGCHAYAAWRAMAHEGARLELRMLAMFCVMFRRELINEIGDLDEAFGVGMFEDDDFAMRVRQAGKRIMCLDDVFVHHEGRASFSRLRQQTYDDLFAKNRAYFEQKWGVAWIPHRGREASDIPEHRIAARSRSLAVTEAGDEWVSNLSAIYVAMAQRISFIRQLQRDLDDRTAWALALDQEAQQLREIIQRLQQDFEGRTHWALSLDQQLEQAGEVIAERQREVERLEHGIERLEQEITELSALLADRSEWGRRLSTQVEALQQRVRQLEGSRTFQLTRRLWRLRSRATSAVQRVNPLKKAPVKKKAKKKA